MNDPEQPTNEAGSLSAVDRERRAQEADIYRQMPKLLETLRSRRYALNPAAHHLLDIAQAKGDTAAADVLIDWAVHGNLELSDVQEHEMAGGNITRRNFLNIVKSAGLTMAALGFTGKEFIEREGIKAERDRLFWGATEEDHAARQKQLSDATTRLLIAGGATAVLGVTTVANMLRYLDEGVQSDQILDDPQKFEKEKRGAIIRLMRAMDGIVPEHRHR